MYKANIIATIVLFILDFLWIGLYMGKQYENQVRKIQKSEMTVRIYFAIFAYILMAIGLNMFVLPQIRKGHELMDSLKYGLTFGIILYGIYDFTAGAVLKDWDISLAFTDIAWGGFVYFVSAYIGSKFG